MIYIAGFIGFIGGFFIGQLILLRLLKDYSNDEILHNGKLKWLYGTFNWLVAFLGAASLVWAYNLYWPG